MGQTADKLIADQEAWQPASITHLPCPGASKEQIPKPVSVCTGQVDEIHVRAEEERTQMLSLYFLPSTSTTLTLL